MFFGLIPVCLAQERDQIGALRSKLGVLQKAMEEIRGEKLTREVKVELAPVESAASVSSATSERAARRARALERLGLLPRSRPSGGEASGPPAPASSGGQTLAWYEPAARTLFLVPHGPGLDASLESTVVHELDHALEDERHDLAAYYATATDEDCLLARRIVAEGEASYVAAVWDTKRRKRADKVDDLLEKRAAQTRTERTRALREQAKATGDAGVLAAVEAEDALPLYTYRTLVDPYVQGSAIVARVVAKSGWAGVDDLYAHPPRTTRELFHLEKRGLAREELAVHELARAFGDGFERSFETSLGEVGLAAFLEARVPTKRGAAGARLAALLAADRLVACEDARHEPSLAWVLAGDDEAGAHELEGAALEAARGVGGGGGEAYVERRGRRVVLVLGAARPQARIVAALAVGGY